MCSCRREKEYTEDDLMVMLLIVDENVVVLDNEDRVLERLCTHHCCAVDAKSILYEGENYVRETIPWFMVTLFALMTMLLMMKMNELTFPLNIELRYSDQTIIKKTTIKRSSPIQMLLFLIYLLMVVVLLLTVVHADDEDDDYDVIQYKYVD